jgi:hypothetical protein
MYKILYFGLFLIGSLLMSALTLNVNLLSNAMAQEYDDYYGDSYYTAYPTDDKKYECRTGPFEGFFVSSVEFCKHVKFDNDRKDNRDNRTGTQGPPGPAGPQGIQGPIGITPLNSSNIYRVDNSSTSAPLSNFTQASATCDPSDFTIDGGYNLFGSDIKDDDSLITFIDQPRDVPFGGGWSTVITNIGNTSTVTLNVIAYCFDNPPFR